MRGKIGLVAAIMAVGVFACGASAAMIPGWTYVEGYEMDVMPNAAGGALCGNLMEAATGSGTYGPSGSVVDEGILTFLDDGSSSGNQGLRLNNAVALLGTDGYTADFRIKWLAGPTGTADMKSLGFAGMGSDGLARGRSLCLYDNRIEYRGNGLYGTANMDVTDWVDLRVVVLPDGSQTLYPYLSDVPLMSITAPGGTGVNGAITAGNGFFIGSWGGSSTTLTNFQIDYLRIGDGIDPLHDYTPEPATLALLALGAIPMLRRRR